jgi:pyruvate formate lyase activating enzyme
VNPVAETIGGTVDVIDGPPGPASATAAVRIGGFTPLSTCDWPGLLAATVFCQGCALRCEYCHNPDLIPATGRTSLRWDEVISVLRRRRGLLDGVVFSGGEPTMDPALAEAMREVRDHGFRVGLHTSGVFPRRLHRVLDLVDWVGLDVKAPPRLYGTVSGVPNVASRVWESLELLGGNTVPYEVRTTMHPDLDERALVELAVLLGERGVPTAALQTRHDDDPVRVRRVRDLPQRVLDVWREQIDHVILRD